MPEDAMEELLDELEDKRYLIIWDLEERMP